MTTIAYSKGMLASDSRATRKAVIDDDQTKKIWRLPDGSLFGGSGDYSGVLRLLEFLRTIKIDKNGKKKLPNVSEKCDALLITPYSVFYYEKGFWEDIRRPFYAIGTGCPYAMVAMECGKNAKEAIKYAIGKDIYSGGRIQCLTFRKTAAKK